MTIIGHMLNFKSLKKRCMIIFLFSHVISLNTVAFSLGLHHAGAVPQTTIRQHFCLPSLPASSGNVLKNASAIYLKPVFKNQFR